MDADICVVGVGVVPATSFLKGSRVPMSERGEVIVNEVKIINSRYVIKYFHCSLWKPVRMCMLVVIL